MTPRTVNASVFKGIYEKALAGSVSAELEARLQDVGVDLAQLEAEYPHATWLRAMELTAQELFPGRPQDDALKKLGRRIVTGLKDQGVIKGPVLAMAKLMGPRRALKEVVSRSAADGSSIRMELVEHGARALTLKVDDGSIAELFAGALEPLIELLGGKRPTVTARVHGPDRCELDISWH